MGAVKSKLVLFGFWPFLHQSTWIQRPVQYHVYKWKSWHVYPPSTLQSTLVISREQNRHKMQITTPVRKPKPELKPYIWQTFLKAVKRTKWHRRFGRVCGFFFCSRELWEAVYIRVVARPLHPELLRLLGLCLCQALDNINALENSWHIMGRVPAPHANSIMFDTKHFRASQTEAQGGRRKHTQPHAYCWNSDATKYSTLRIFCSFSNSGQYLFDVGLFKSVSLMKEDGYKSNYFS